MVSKLTKYSCIPGLLTFGTGNVLVQKLLFSFSSEGIDAEGNPDYHAFIKPWFQTESMFFGMFFCVLAYKINCWIKSCKRSQTPKPDIESSLVETTQNDSVVTSDMVWTNYFWICIPAMCDFSSTCFMNIGLFYLDASIWQMLRGSMVLFTAFMSIFIFKKKFRLYEWLSMLSVVLGLVIVASAPLLKFDAQEKNTNSLGAEVESGDVVMALFLVIAAQIIQSGQMVSEEFLMKKISVASTFIVGLEGFWGGLVCTIVLFIIQYTPTDIPLVAKIFHENTIDTFTMLGNNSTLLTVLVIYIFCCFGYNFFAIMVTETYSAVYRTIVEAARTLCIWIVSIIIFYCTPEDASIRFGEAISWKSLVELVGFLFIISGSFTYNKIVKLPCVKYED